MEKIEEEVFYSNIIVYPLKNYNSFLSLQDAIKCVSSRDPNNKFLTLTPAEQEAILISYSDTLTALYNVPQDNLVDNLEGQPDFIYDTGDEIMINGEKYTTMSDGSLKKLVVVTDAQGDEVYL